MAKVLIVSAHPDDETLGCGATITRMAQQGFEVTTLILGEGIASRTGSEGDTEAVQALKATAEKANTLIGVNRVIFGGLPDNRFDTVPLLEVVKIIECAIEEVQPEMVFTQHGGDLNIDHAITYRATLIATRPMAGSPVKDVYAYEVGSSTEWAFGSFAPAFQPNYYLGVTKEHLEKKVAAMQLYETEVRNFPHPRSPEAIKVKAWTRGSECGLGIAEAFQLVRSAR